MYLAKSNNGSLTLYATLFNKLAKGDEIDSKEEIIDVIKETKNILAGEKDIFTARSDYYSLMSFLLSNGQEFLNRLDEDRIDNETFKSIANILSKKSIPA